MEEQVCRCDDEGPRHQGGDGDRTPAGASTPAPSHGHVGGRATPGELKLSQETQAFWDFMWNLLVCECWCRVLPGTVRPGGVCVQIRAGGQTCPLLDSPWDRLLPPAVFTPEGGPALVPLGVAPFCVP